MPDVTLLEDPELEGVRDWGHVLKLGRANAPAAVRAVQVALAAVGAKAPVTGTYDAATKAAVVQFQRWAHLEDDGIFGTRTLHALADAVANRVRIETPSRADEPIRGIFSADRFGPEIALTFDDGPNPRTTPAILETLRAAQVRATFFVLGNATLRHPELVARIAEDGHTVGSHSFDHPKLDTLSPAALDAQLGRTQAAVDAALGRPSPLHLVRPPYGRPFFNTGSEHRAKVSAAFKRAGLQVVMWQIDTNDWQFPGRPDAVVSQAAQALRAGRTGVLLMHDVHVQSRDALPRVIDAIRARRLALTTVDALLEQKYGPPIA